MAKTSQAATSLQMTGRMTSNFPRRLKASPLDAPLIQLRGVGQERASQLARLKLHTIRELLLYRPRRHEDRRHFHSIKDLELNRPATTRGTVVALGVKKYAKGTKSVFE